jgi:DNA invertase Pin-like site-specific DNA recombinase
MRAVIYTRTSTSQQRNDMQLEALHNVVKNSNYELIDVIEDVGVSGRKDRNKRAGMKKLMQLVAHREVDVVCVYSVDRLGRNMADVISIVEEIDSRGVSLIIHKQGLATHTPQGKILVGFFALMAQMEADFIASRVADGMAVAKSKGVVFGRPKMSPQKQQEIIRLRKEGFSMNNIAKQLNVGNSQVHRICKEMLEAA